MLFERARQQLEARQSQGLLRQTQVFQRVDARQLWLEDKPYLNFSSNDYLGIGSERNETAAAAFGALASPLVVGRSQAHDELEQELYEWLDVPSSMSCLLFSSGFAANTGVIRTLFNTKSGNAILLQDKLNHASLLDAGAVCQAQRHVKQYRFNHNDIAHVSELLSKYKAGDCPSLVACEGVYSMDGDSPMLTSLQALVKQHSVPWLLDDAHGIGVRGKEGRGSLDAQGLSVSDCDILVVTFGKALGAQGAAVIADRAITDYLTNFCKEYIYSTHLSPLQAAAVLSNIKRVRQDDWRREKLANNIQYFKDGVASTGYSLLASDSAIQPLIIGDEIAALELSVKLRQKGIWASAMRYPTVAKGQARLRFTLTASHQQADLDRVLECLHD